jgi:hypothetical protein
MDHDCGEEESTSIEFWHYSTYEKSHCEEEQIIFGLFEEVTWRHDLNSDV